MAFVQFTNNRELSSFIEKHKILTCETSETHHYSSSGIVVYSVLLIGTTKIMKPMNAKENYFFVSHNGSKVEEWINDWKLQIIHIPNLIQKLKIYIFNQFCDQIANNTNVPKALTVADMQYVIGSYL